MDSIEYRDLLVAVWADESPGLFRAKAEEEFGRTTPTARIYLPFDDRWFIQFADRAGELSSRELHYVGARLFDSLFQGEILRLYVHLLEQVRNTGAKLRVRLKLEPPIVARLPWECLYDTRNGTFLATFADATLIRYRPPAALEPEPAPAAPPLRVLLVAESPAGRASSRVASEARAVGRALSDLRAEGVVSVFEAGTELGGASLTPDSMETVLAQHFDVVHWIGDAEGNGEHARFLTGEEGIRHDAFSEALEASRPCLLLWSGGADSGLVAPGLADRLLQFMPAVVNQRHRLPDEILSAYTASLYRALSAAMPVDGAVAEAARDALGAPSEDEWVAPAVFVSRKDGAVTLSPTRGGISDVYQISEGHYRRRLRESLNRFWPKPERYFPQPLRWMPRSAPLVGYVHAAEFLGQPQSASELSRRFQRLLLIGDAGTGKSMALYRLFYETAQSILSYETKSPLPIYLSLPDLGESKDLFELLASNLDRDLFTSDLEEGRFLFLFDALDGLSARGASRRAESLNAFMRRFPLNRFVVSVRSPSPKPVEIPNWAEMLPFSEWEAMDFLIADEGIRAESAKILYSELASSLGPLVGNPQLLALARRLWREGARMPTTKTGIFQSFFRIAGASLAAEARDQLLPQLAFFMSQSDRISLTKAHLEAGERSEGWVGVAHDLALKSTGTSGVAEILAEVGKTRLLRGPVAFTFPNVAFQEFLTAYGLRSAATNTVLNLIQPADWRELDENAERPLNLSRGPFHGVLPFLCGLRYDGPRMVESLVDRDLVLASECFRESRPSTTVDLMLRAAVERALQDEDDVSSSKIACLSLEARGDGWAVEMLERIASEPSAGRALALEALGKLRSVRSLEVLESAVEASDTNVAKAAMDALARIKVS